MKTADRVLIVLFSLVLIGLSLHISAAWLSGCATLPDIFHEFIVMPFALPILFIFDITMNLICLLVYILSAGDAVCSHGFFELPTTRHIVYAIVDAMTHRLLCIQYKWFA